VKTRNNNIIELYPAYNKEKYTEEYFEEQGFEFEGWEAEYELTEAKDWEGLIEYYKTKIKQGQTGHCFQVARVYIENLHQYQKAIDFLKPFSQKEPDIEEIKQEIKLAQNFIDKKDIKLTKQDLTRGFNTDTLRLFDFDSKFASENKTFRQNLSSFFKKYEYIIVDTQNNIYAISKNSKDFIRKNYDSYTTAYDLLNF